MTIESIWAPSTSRCPTCGTVSGGEMLVELVGLGARRADVDAVFDGEQPTPRRSGGAAEMSDGHLATTGRRLAVPVLSLAISVVALVVATSNDPSRLPTQHTAAVSVPVTARSTDASPQVVTMPVQPEVQAARIVSCYRTFGRWPC